MHGNGVCLVGSPGLVAEEIRGREDWRDIGGGERKNAAIYPAPPVPTLKDNMSIQEIQAENIKVSQ